MNAIYIDIFSIGSKNTNDWNNSVRLDISGDVVYIVPYWINELYRLSHKYSADVIWLDGSDSLSQVSKVFDLSQTRRLRCDDKFTSTVIYDDVIRNSYRKVVWINNSKEILHAYHLRIKPLQGFSSSHLGLIEDYFKTPERLNDDMHSLS